MRITPAGHCFAYSVLPSIVAIGSLLLGAQSVIAADQQLPTVDKINAIVQKSLARDASYQPGDLLTQSQVAVVLGEIKKAGWEVPATRELLARVPHDHEFLIRALRTGKGVGFMRRVASMPNGFDRVDRLSRLPNGQATIKQLIATPDGHKLIGYMTESSGGKQLGVQLAGTAAGGDFNKPTGRIYSAQQLLAELEKLHIAARTR
jgi:hypothetical protein